jgi:hypothetical protein
MITRFKIFENVQQSKSLLNNLDIDINDSRYLELKKMLGKNLGYLGKFTEWLFNDGIDINFLKTLYSELIKVKLDKPIDTFETSEDLYDYLTEGKINTKVNQVINSLPSGTRRLVNQELKDLISLNSKYIDTLKDFYSKKGGRYKDIQTLTKDTKKLINNLSGGWNVESIKYKESEVVYKDDHTLILHINSYDRSCDLGSQHWCISTDESQWEDYTKDFKKQYFIYDFTKEISDKKSMIGVTIKPDGRISAAHYRDDTEPKNYNELSMYKQYLTPTSKKYILSKIDTTNIALMFIYGFIEEVENTDDYKWLIDYFKSLIFRYEKSVETWYDKNDQWTIQIWEGNWNYSRFYYKNWQFLEEKYGLNYDQTSDLVKGMLELTLNRKVSSPLPHTRWS